jgi:hypothetical protein
VWIEQKDEIMRDKSAIQPRLEGLEQRVVPSTLAPPAHISAVHPDAVHVNSITFNHATYYIQQRPAGQSQNVLVGELSSAPVNVPGVGPVVGAFSFVLGPGRPPVR